MERQPSTFLAGTACFPRNGFDTTFQWPTRDISTMGFLPDHRRGLDWIAFKRRASRRWWWASYACCTHGVPRSVEPTLRHTQSTVTIVSTMSNPTFWYSFTAMPIHHGGIVGVQHWCAPPALSSFARAAALWNSLVRLSAIAWTRLISPGVTPGLDRFQSATL